MSMTEEDREPPLDFCEEGNGGHCYRNRGEVVGQCIYCGTTRTPPPKELTDG